MVCVKNIIKSSTVLAMGTLLMVSCTTTNSSSANTNLPPIDGVEGVVTMVGSSPNARPVIESFNPQSQTEICPGSQRDYLGKFTGTIVKVKGDWGKSKITKEKCYDIKTIEVSQVVKGRPAYVGMLTKKADQTFLTTLDGKVMVLESPTSGVAGLVGKKVILDMLPSSNQNPKKGGDPLWKVVTYMEYPNP